jgi:prepilin-type processing-associated H-X9-DG protein
MSDYLRGAENKYRGPRIDDYTIAATGQNLAAIVSPSHKVMLGDVYKGSGYVTPLLRPTVSTYADEYYKWPLDMEFDDSTAWGADAVKWYHTGRHFGGANVAFVDGHVKFMKSATPGLMFADSGTCSVGSSGSWCKSFYGTDEFISYWNPGSDEPY